MFYLLHFEHSEAGNKANVRHFLFHGEAKAAMEKEFDFHKKTLGIPPEDDEHSVSVSENKIIIRDGEDYFYWEIGTAVPQV